MTAFNKENTSSIQRERPKPLLESFSVLFYLCKLFGISSQDLGEFRKYKHLKKSPGGEGLVIIGIIILFINFNLMIGVFQTNTYIEEKDPLTVGIGFILTYFSLVLFMADRICALWKQQSFLNIFEELEEIDEDFRDLNITFNNNRIKYFLLVGILVPSLLEIFTFILTFTLFVDIGNWTAVLWIYTNVPTYFNSLDKLWYLGILLALKMRFEAINKAFDKEAKKIELEKQKELDLKSSKKPKKNKYYTFKNQIRPAINNFQIVFGDEITEPPIFPTLLNNSLPSILTPPTSTTSSNSSYSTIPVYATVEERFIKLCQLHDTLCNVSKQLNEVYGFPILILMGFGFFMITAQLYFFYCGQVDQLVPAIFRPAANWWVTGLYILYICMKCVSILYGNWLTNLESKMTGICIHRYAMADDKNETYEMINHLSLKLFNHPLDFNACGYFPLNMATLFSGETFNVLLFSLMIFKFCGGITTYLIILIQFNLEEQQVKKTNREMTKNVSFSLNNTGADFSVENMVNGTRNGNATSLWNIFYQLWIDYFNEM